jgi:hypothetical protein
MITRWHVRFHSPFDICVARSQLCMHLLIRAWRAALLCEAAGTRPEEPASRGCWIRGSSARIETTIDAAGAVACTQSVASATAVAYRREAGNLDMWTCSSEPGKRMSAPLEQKSGTTLIFFSNARIGAQDQARLPQLRAVVHRDVRATLLPSVNFQEIDHSVRAGNAEYRDTISAECPVWVVCHERRRSTRLRATVREMKEGPSRSAIMS